MDSSTVGISVSSNPRKDKGDKDSRPNEKAFSVSLDLARGDAEGEAADQTLSISLDLSGEGGAGGAETASITVSGVDTAGLGGEDGEVTIETVVFSGDDLAANLKASTVLGGGAVARTVDGSFGVEGSVSGSADIRLEVGETLSFQLPTTEGEVVGGQVTITNLFSDGVRKEGALVFAFDADDQQLACYCAIGNETGTVTLDIDVPFARLDFKALDNDSWLLQENSNFTVGDIGVKIASFVDDTVDSIGDFIDDLVSPTRKLHNPDLIDFGHFGLVNFEIKRIDANRRVTLDSLDSVEVGREREQERPKQDRLDDDRDDFHRRS